MIDLLKDYRNDTAIFADRLEVFLDCVANFKGEIIDTNISFSVTYYGNTYNEGFTDEFFNYYIDILEREGLNNQ
jgi:hypothetical protein